MTNEDRDFTACSEVHLKYKGSCPCCGGRIQKSLKVSTNNLCEKSLGEIVPTFVCFCEGFETNPLTGEQVNRKGEDSAKYWQDQYAAGKRRHAIGKMLEALGQIHTENNHAGANEFYIEAIESWRHKGGIEWEDKDLPFTREDVATQCVLAEQKWVEELYADLADPGCIYWEMQNFERIVEFTGRILYAVGEDGEVTWSARDGYVCDFRVRLSWDQVSFSEADMIAIKEKASQLFEEQRAALPESEPEKTPGRFDWLKRLLPRQ